MEFLTSFDVCGEGCPIKKLVASPLFLNHFESTSWKTMSNYSIYVVECSCLVSVDSYEMCTHLMVLFVFLYFSYHLNVFDMTQVSRLSI